MSEYPKIDVPASADDIIRKSLPASLGDIVRKNRDKFSLRLANPEDFARLKPMVSMLDNFKQIRATVNDWRIICLVQPAGPALILTGINESRQAPWATSEVLSVDFENALVLTSNSIYRLGSKGEDEPNIYILLHICATFHIWGFGEHIGAPHIFY